DHNVISAKKQNVFINSCFIQSLLSNKFLFQVFERQQSMFLSENQNTDENDADEQLMQDFLHDIESKKQNERKELVLLQKHTVDEMSAFQNEAKYSQFLHKRDLKEVVTLLKFDDDSELYKTQFVSLVIDYLLILSENKL